MSTAYDIPVQCSRCRNKHMESERKSIDKGGGHAELVCPCCGCKSYYDLRKWFAWCWATGVIEFGEKVPGGAIAIAQGPKAFLRGVVDVVARHSYTGGELLVPGVPEADDQSVASDALEKWLKWCANRNGKKGSNGVTFYVPASDSGIADGTNRTTSGAIGQP